jgi:hypothetical protein
MIRRFVYLLLVAVTLQLSWGTVSAYCEHESGRAARHFGHHQHADADSAQAAADLATGDIGAAGGPSDHAGEPSDGVAKSKAHTHCSSCSHGALAAVIVDGGIAHLGAAGIAPPAPLLHITSSYRIPPERPQWLNAA